MAQKWKHQILWFEEPTSLEDKLQFENALNDIARGGGEILSVVPATGTQWAVIFRVPLKTPPSAGATYAQAA